MSLIYKIENKINKKCYIGQTIQKLSQRLYQHMYAASNNSLQLIHKAIRKYGIDNFHIEVVKICNTQHELNLYEEKMILKYNGMVPYGYNLKTGGHHIKYSKESRLKMSLAQKGKVLSIEHRNKISTSCKGKPGPWKGKKFSKNHKQNISNGNKGKVLSKLTRDKIAATKIGSKNPMYGRLGEDHPNAKKVTLQHSNGSVEEFNSLSDACRKYNLDVRNLSAVCLGKRNSHRGFKLYTKNR